MSQALWRPPVLMRTMGQPRPDTATWKHLVICRTQSLSGCLPWKNNLKDPLYIRDSVMRPRENTAGFRDKFLPGSNKPEEIAEYTETVKGLHAAETSLS